MRKAVVLGVHYYIGLSVIRLLKLAGVTVVAADNVKNAYGLCSRFVDETLRLPQDTGGDAIAKALIAYAKRQDEKPLLMPCHDYHATYVDTHFDALKAHFVFPQMTPGLVTRCCDKSDLRTLAEAHGVLIPPTVSLAEPDLVGAVAQSVGYPCIVKPDDSSAFVATFAKKVFVVDDAAALMRAAVTMKEAGFTGQVQRIIQGFDDHMYTYDAYIDRHGEVTHWMTCQKKRQWPINFGASTFIVQRPVPELHAIGAPFLKAIGWRGFAEIEFKKDARDGRFYLIEINTRTTNFNAMINACGINMPYVCYQDMNGETLTPCAILDDRHQAFRYGYDDFKARRAYRKTKQLTRRDMKEQERGCKVTNAIWAWNDPAPALCFARNLVLYRLRRLVRHGAAKGDRHAR